ncbi:STAS domain-containing protein [Nannocystis sp. SCPEA4]|uniref:STAS domain-containing protein n=1 Tax=Nannocystis sp. SCPEA4 TaxID=2996787 RepID=UPI00226EE7F4|nr:STAS domain-containing protein [Nannocystis sp. SCPEA4]MCY1059738.1 PAS domain-containing protein [Nannocystis sp. SCPEA4]
MATDSVSGFELLQDAPFVALQVDSDGTIIAWNAAAEAVFGVTSDDAVGRPIGVVVPVPGGDDAWRALLAEGRGARRVWATPREGRQLVTCDWTLRPLSGGGAVFYGQPAPLTVDTQQHVRDVLLRALLDNVELLAWVADMSGTALLFDGIGLARSGLTPEMLIGQNLLAAFGEKYPAVPEAFKGQAVRYFTREGEACYDNWAVPVRDGQGRQIAVAGVALDITESRRREEELQDKLDVIERQQRAMREMSTPIIEVWDRVICLPIVGLVDTARAADVMDNLLQAITRTRARFAILDLTGVDVVDTSTASHLLSLIRAVRLLGAEGVLTGVHPNIAQTIVTLGVDLTTLHVRATLRDALKYVLAELERR